MAFQIWLDFGSGWEDISSKLVGRFPVSRTRAIHAKGDPSKPVIGTARFKIARDTTLVNRFLSASGSIAVKIQKDGAAYFLGQIRDTPKTKAELMALERFEVECVDVFMRLEKRCTVSATWANFAVSNPANKAASILHQLLYAAGFADAELNLAAIAITIDRFSLDKTRGETYRQIFERILLETGFSAKASPAGVVELYDLGPATITPTATLSTDSAGNIAKGFEIAKNEARAEAVDVSYWSHLTLAGAVLFEDTTGGGALPCSIPLTAGSYYPQGADATHDVRAELKLSDYEIIAVDSAAVEWDHTGDVVKQVETIEGLGVRIRFYSATGGVLTKLRIRGNALVRGDLYKVIRENVASTEKRESLELSTIYTAAAAERVAIIRANWHANSRFDHSFPEVTLLSLAPGDYVQLTDTAILGSSQVLRVVQIEDGTDPLSIKVLCEGASAYSYVALPRTIESGRPTPDYPPAIGGTPIEIVADRTPPSVPTGVSSSQLSTGALRVGFTGSVDIESGVSHYRIYRREQGSAAEGVVAQVLEDGSGSYIVDDTSPVVGKIYEFAVSAVDKRGNESALSSWTAALASVVTDAPPNVAGAPTAKASSALMVVIWAVVASAVAYRVERSTDSGSTWPTSFTAAANRLEDPIAAGVEIAALANYRYRVKALSIYQALSAAWATSGVPDTTGYGTYVPAAPTVSYNAAKRSILAQITPQANLLNPDGWDVQIQRPTDGANWFCPNLAAKSDADPYYTGAAGGSLHLYEPSVKLNFLPIPTSGTPALPAEAGQGYYLRVRARCSSPVAQSGWTTSAILTVTPTLGIDFARAQVLPEILAAISKNKINSFINADDGTSGWTIGSGSTVEVVDSVRTLKLLAPNASLVSTPFEVLPDELLEFTFGVSCPNYSSLSGMYIGLTTADTYLRYRYIFAEKKWTYQSTAANQYFVSNYIHTTRKNFKTYILGNNVDISSVPAPETTDELYAIDCLKLSPGKTTASVRSGYNPILAGTYWYFYQPQIYRVGAGKVVAANIYALTLSAIRANMGEITAGKLKSYDWVSGVSGFIIDLDTGEIVQEGGNFRLAGDGSFEAAGAILTSALIRSALSGTRIEIDPASPIALRLTDGTLNFLRAYTGASGDFGPGDVVIGELSGPADTTHNGIMFDRSEGTLIARLDELVLNNKAMLNGLSAISYEAKTVSLQTLRHYKLNSLTLVDDGIDGLDGTIFGGALVTGKINNAISLDGIDDYCSFPAFASPASTQLDIAFWAKLAAETDKVMVGQWQASGGGTDAWLLVLNYAGANTVTFYGVGGSGVSDLNMANITWPVGDWFHIKFSYDAGNVRIYLNGILAHTGNLETTSLRSTSLPIWMGRYNSAYGKSVIDDLRINTGILPDYAALKLYNSGQGTEEDTAVIDTYNLFPDPAITGFINNATSINGIIEVAGCIRQNSDLSWSFINDDAHEPLNLINIYAGDIGGVAYVSVFYSFVALKVITLQATPDETFAKSGVAVGASVGLSYARLNFGRNGVALSHSQLWSYGGSKANIWLSGKFKI